MRRSVIALLAFVVSTAPAAASTIVPMSFSELVNDASAIVYARVADVRGQWTDDRRAIESLVTVDVVTAFKGTPGSTVTFAVPGGQLGRFLSFMPGVPTFARGDLVVVFLTAHGPRLPGPTGLSQGVFRVVTDRVSGALHVVAPIVGAGTKIVRGDPERRPLSIPAFGEAVRAAREPRP